MAKRNRLQRSGGFGFALALALVSSTVAIEPVRAQGDEDIDEIVVLGDKSEASDDFATGDSVTGFSAEDLEALGAQSIADLASFTPNLEIVTSGATTPTFFIRGVGLNDFNANSTGAVAIYVDDVAINAPALQLGTLFDMETVDVLRGPQGTGLARNASAGAIKLFTRKPSGRFGGRLSGEWGKYDHMNYEGAVEAPIYSDLLSGRVAFRLTQRDGTMRNRCGGAAPFDQRIPRPSSAGPFDKPYSICGEPVGGPLGPEMGISQVPAGLEKNVNDEDRWAARGTLLFQPTLDQTWFIGFRTAKIDEISRVGQSYGTNGFFCVRGDIDNCFPGNRLFPDTGSRIQNILGGSQGNAGYQAPEVRRRLANLVPCIADGSCNQGSRREDVNRAKQRVAKELARYLDRKPWAGDFNDVGDTVNETYGAYLNGEIALGGSLVLETSTGFDTYDRQIELDLDFSPETLFHIDTDDDGWQVYQDLKLSGTTEYFPGSPLRWEIGGYGLVEELNVAVDNDFGVASEFSVGNRDYTQDLQSIGVFTSFSWDFWEDFTLDGGARFNYEHKEIDYLLLDLGGTVPISLAEEDTWMAPTGTIRLLYRFRQDTHAYWKYTRGWKPGHYNATGSRSQGITIADPETIDSFETGLSGVWFDGIFRLTGSLFYYTYNDYQIFTAQQFAGGGPEFVVINANDAEVYGAEIDAILRPWPGAFFNVRFAWLESQFLDFILTQQAEVPGPGGATTKVIDRQLQNSGNPLLNSPRYTVNLTVEQALPIAGGRYGSLVPRYDGTWTDDTFYDATQGKGIPNNENLQYLPNYTVGQKAHWKHNLRLAWRSPDGSFEIAGWVRNLTNIATKSFAFDGSTFQSTTIYFVGDPRTWGVSTSVNF